MSNFSIEIGENQKTSKCHCCGKKSCVGHGFVYKNDDAYAVYYAGWSDAHLKRKVSFALAIGRWDDDSTIADRTSFGVEAFEDEEKIVFRVVEPGESPWPNTDLLGQMLTRKEGLSHPLLNEVFLIAENILRDHKAIREYLGLQNFEKFG